VHNNDGSIIKKLIEKEDVMFEQFFKSHVKIQKLRDSNSGNLLEEFAEKLFQEGYAVKTSRQYIGAVEHFIYWADIEGIPVLDYTEELAVRFGEHLNECKCPDYNHTKQQGLICGVRLFLKHIKNGEEKNVTNQSTAEDIVLLTEFYLWMRNNRGTSNVTLSRYGCQIKDLLKRFDNNPEIFDAKGLRQFVFEKSQHFGWSNIKNCITALRMFLRFLIAEGKCSANLFGAIPTVAHWRLSSLPRYLQEADVEKIISVCDINSKIGKRNRVILLLLARLGLRAGDIIKLRLGDIDWKASTVQVSGKGHRAVHLPLTNEVGLALVDYLRNSRPQLDTDVVFVKLRAPLRPFASHSAISVIVARAMRRAGIKCEARGAAHILRHSMATSMLRHGATLQEISEILRHRSIETTKIYAKVDLTTLQEIVLPWPEVEPC
jgi:integrase/recombinase XerD